MRTIREPGPDDELSGFVDRVYTAALTHMQTLSPLNLQRWVDEHRHLLKPPVGNKLIYQDSEFIVMAVGGPNARRDFHVDPGEEFFHQLEGTMTLRVVENGKVRDVPIRAGEIMLLPAHVPHSPQRPAGTVGLVIERQRRPGELDGLQWYCERCSALLYEEHFVLTDIETQFPPVFDRFFGSLERRTCRQCGAVAAPAAARAARRAAMTTVAPPGTAQPPRTAQLDIEDRRYAIDLAGVHDLAITLDFNGTQPAWFGGAPARRVPLVLGAFSGRVDRGSSCNCSTLSFTPHCDGTHTECVGHLTVENLDARTVVPTGFIPAALLSVAPTAAGDTREGSRPPSHGQDLLITAAALRRAWPAAPDFVPSALIVRTLPNPVLKRTRDYRTQPAPYLSLQAAQLLVERGIEHLVLDVPSADRADDDGQLSAHRVFFGLEPGETALAAARRPQCTITELAYVDSAAADGGYLLSLQIPAFGGDAVPSRPLLYPVRAL